MAQPRKITNTRNGSDAAEQSPQARSGGSSRAANGSADLSRLRQVVERIMLSGADRLPPERELAAELGQTRSRLRVALKQLADEGLIWRGVGNGTYLGARPLLLQQGGALGGLAAMINPREVMEARLVLEPEVVKMAAFRAKQEHIEEFDLCLEKMKGSSDVSEWLFWDKRFHRSLCRSANNTMLLFMIEAIQSNMGRENLGGLMDNLQAGDNLVESMREHSLIVEAVRARSAEGAASAMKAHLMRVRRALFGE